MHRVELKERVVKTCAVDSWPFLMHRVELKASNPLLAPRNQISVPNAPCGVERLKYHEGVSLPHGKFLMHRVELKGTIWRSDCPLKLKFLMHRVELKVTLGFLVLALFNAAFLMHRVELKENKTKRENKRTTIVPNAPCGVESKEMDGERYLVLLFLMHRVELKGGMCGRW